MSCVAQGPLVNRWIAHGIDDMLELHVDIVDNGRVAVVVELAEQPVLFQFLNELDSVIRLDVVHVARKNNSDVLIGIDIYYNFEFDLADICIWYSIQLKN